MTDTLTSSPAQPGRPSPENPSRDIPSRADLVERAEQLIPLLAANAAQTEADRRIAADNMAALEEAGLLRLSVPQRHGGYEAPIRTWLEVQAALARGCGSTAWVTSLFTVGNWFAGQFGAQAQADVYGRDGSARISGVFTPTGTSRKVDGGWVVSGSWAWASGAWHATWALVSFPLTDETGAVTDIGFGLVPMTQIAVKETWFVAGLAGTGSNTLIAEDVFVPEHRVMSVSQVIAGQPATPYDQESLYQAPVIAVGCLVLAAPQLGIARAALDHVVAAAAHRGVAYTTYEAQTDAPTVQLGVGQAASQIGAAQAIVYSLADEITVVVESGRKTTVSDRARIRALNAYAVRIAADAVSTLVSAHGASSFAQSSPLQRYWRDSAVIARHAFTLYETATEILGKVTLGVENLPTGML